MVLEPHQPGSSSRGTWLGPVQDACHLLSDQRLPSSTGLRSPALSPENSGIEDTIGHPGCTSVASTLENSTSTCRESLDSAEEYAPTRKLPQRLRTFKSGTLLNRCRRQQHFRFEPKLRPPTSSNIFKLWKWEIVNCVLATGMLGSIYGILQRYDDQRIPDWGTTINLSTLAALIATLLRALLVFVVAEIIGQAKWRYFAGEGRPTEEPPVRRLIQTSRFNDASQGSLGAVKLLPTIFRDPATLLAVMIMIVSMGTGSFVQQAIQTQSCQFAVDSVAASLPISKNVTAGRGGKKSVFGPLDIPNVLAALSSALAPDSEKIGSPISVGCPTGNCTFQTSIGGVYSTLGVCSSCVDTSSLITSTGWTFFRQEYAQDYNRSTGEYIVTGANMYYTANFTLPVGKHVEATFNNITSPYTQATKLMMTASADLGLNWAGDLASPEMKALSQWALANVTVLTSNWLPTSTGYTDYVAATCTLYPCLRSYNASVTSGQLREDLISTAPVVPNVAAIFAPNITTEAIHEEVSGDNWYPSIYSTNPVAQFQAVKSPCLVNNTVWTKSNQSSTLDMQRLLLLHANPNPSGAQSFTVENITAPAECVYTMDVVAVSDFSFLMTNTSSSFNGACSAQSSVNSTGNTMQIDCEEKYWLARFYSDDGTTADSIIKRFEAFADRLSNKMRMGLLNDAESVSGQVLQATMCSKIHYSWLTFPAVLVTVTTGLLAWTMFQSSRRRGREMVWKTSILPFLFYSERFVVQNGEDVSAYSAEASRRDEAKEPLLDLDRMEADARQRVVRFNALE